MLGKSLPKTAGFLAGILLVSFLTRTIITGGKPTINLPAGSSLAGSVSIGLSQTSTSALPQAGKDYQLASSRYFDNNEWIVVKVVPLKNKADPAFLVLKKINGIYQAVLGPDGQFDSSYFYVMPHDVGRYLAQQGAYSGR